MTDHSLRIPRRPFRRILVGVDASPASEGATRMAVALAAGDRRIEVVFAHAIDISRMLAHADRYTDDYPLALEAARTGAHHLLDRCCALAAQNGVVARACVRLGDPTSS